MTRYFELPSGTLNLFKVVTALAFFLRPWPAIAQQETHVDRFSFHARSQTYSDLFQRAPLPGQEGKAVDTETHLRFLEHVHLAGRDFDTSFGEDTASFELSAWGSVDAGQLGDDDRFQGDIQTALFRIQTSPGSHPAELTLGRQVQSGGAVRFLRFDGASGRIALTSQLTINAYGGFTVLPPSLEAPEYYVAVSNARSPGLVAEPARRDYATVGGRINFDTDRHHVALSFHEQSDAGGLGQRNIGLDFQSMLSERIDLGGAALLDLAGVELARASLYGNVVLSESLDLSGEYMLADPAALLSKQSVLSVFGSDGYQEAGATLSARLLGLFTFTGGGFVQFYEDDKPGSRLHVGAVFRSGGARPGTAASLTYGRVDSPGNGYHSLHATVSQPLAETLMGTLQSYYYLYDEPISDRTTSIVSSATLNYAFVDRWSMLVAGRLASSPYASLDMSTQLRLSYEFRVDSWRPRW